MAINNKSIETTKTTSFYVILVKRGGIEKFISKNYLSCFPCTVLLNKAKRFTSEKQAYKFIDDVLFSHDNIKVIKPIKVENILSICE
jgi:hypothetical protein